MGIHHGALQPPQLFSVVEGDVAQPNQKELDEALAKSREYWSILASAANAQRDHGILPNFTDPRNSLRRVPKFQARPKKVFTRGRNLAMEASSIWKVSNHGDCDGLKPEVSRRAFMNLAVDKSVSVELDGQAFNTWIGTTDEARANVNYIGILTLGWSYILSARLIELRGKGATLQYTESQAQYNDECTPGCSTTFSLDVGKVDDDVARWWSAILAPGEGWKALVTHNSRDFVSPWSVSRDCARPFSIKHEMPASDSVFVPLSSQRAFEVLSGFSTLHGLGSQFPISLATALALPVHRYFGWTAHLPTPRLEEHKETLGSSSQSLPRVWQECLSDIEYYMSLSCDPERMFSTLCGPFWEPEVPCNLVSPWLHPALNEVITSSLPVATHDQKDDFVPGAREKELSELLSARDQEVFALLCAIRRPSIGALCIGAVISGLGPRIVRRVENGHPPLDQHAFAWTGSPQCFHDFSGVGPYRSDGSDFIARQDVWRLLHLPKTDPDDVYFHARPFGCWAPCGKSPIVNCDLQVASHFDCPRHEFYYDRWRWNLEDGSSFDDYGFSRELTTPVPKGLSDILEAANPICLKTTDLDAEQEASVEACHQIFRWLADGDDGFPSEKVYQDDWIKEILDCDDSNEESDKESLEDDNKPKYDSERESQVQSWVDSTNLEVSC
ncbi:unnamed protein product [Penicillium salamii]|uniref:Uncharacterized protein n=1 Tax=Penicillium salamii TaxID=1612424 RepID=A0A9W4JU50_9EURO|nr:unnamed protein product [Penicillium salamii]CAG8210254.1 unnamed protein product [Penicillium salamii]CAG8210525.1 unnamed protein product [Penicillium salamii]CAG8213253.1 unnamed protein product [Penicillium salamii]CAG8218209.1 unnamed protein product [Penicillium salamii]